MAGFYGKLELSIDGEYSKSAGVSTHRKGE